MLLVFGLYSSSLSFAGRVSFFTSCSDATRLFKLLKKPLLGSLPLLYGARGDNGDCGRSLGNGVRPAAMSCSKLSPKEPRSTPSRFMGLLLEALCVPAFACSVSSAGLDCRGIAEETFGDASGCATAAIRWDGTKDKRREYAGNYKR